MDRLRPYAERHGLTLLQLAAQWDLARPAVACVAPTLIEEPGSRKPVEAKRAELAATPAEVRLTPAEVEEIRALGDNTGSMTLKGASPEHEGPPRPDRWALDPQLAELARRWAIDPRQLARA
jgi:hypothetical protein